PPAPGAPPPAQPPNPPRPQSPPSSPPGVSAPSMQHLRSIDARSLQPSPSKSHGARLRRRGRQCAMASIGCLGDTWTMRISRFVLVAGASLVLGAGVGAGGPRGGDEDADDCSAECESTCQNACGVEPGSCEPSAELYCQQACAQCGSGSGGD